ncbi:hypothetical protein EsH8_IV_000069 [Colletotrichum jinshuiense]
MALNPTNVTVLGQVTDEERRVIGMPSRDIEIRLPVDETIQSVVDISSLPVARTVPPMLATASATATVFLPTREVLVLSASTCRTVLTACIMAFLVMIVVMVPLLRTTRTISTAMILGVVRSVVDPDGHLGILELFENLRGKLDNLFSVGIVVDPGLDLELRGTRVITLGFLGSAMTSLRVSAISDAILPGGF